MPTRDEIIREARAWLGTPWRHQGRLKGVACDCAGLVLEVGKSTGCLPRDGSMDRLDYGRQPDPKRIESVLRAYFDPVPRGEELVGDVVWMRGGKLGQHLGILSEENRLIHALDSRAVMEHTLDRFWRSKIIGLFRYRGING